jgi:acyl-CoA thioester hydrolase
MSSIVHTIQLRVRYGETDQMGTFYNARALDWFECGRTELMRSKFSISYAVLEEKEVFLPVVEAHLEYLNGARYDDLLKVTSTAAFEGRARMRFDVEITKGEGDRVIVRGYTIHAFTNKDARPIRPPSWFVEMFNAAAHEVDSPPVPI